MQWTVIQIHSLRNCPVHDRVMLHRMTTGSRRIRVARRRATSAVHELRPRRDISSDRLATIGVKLTDKAMRSHLAAALALIVLTVAPSTAATGVITGSVITDQHQPAARARVQAFSVRTTVSPPQQSHTVPFSTRASGTAVTDAQGRFKNSG